MNDVLLNRTSFEKDTILPKQCPTYLKFKYVDMVETKPTDAMLYGQYFEWHLLGAVRSGKEPLLPRIGVKDQRPPKSATKEVMASYIANNFVDESSTKLTYEGWLSMSKEALVSKIASMPENPSKGEPSAQQKTLDQVIAIAKSVLNLMGIPVDQGEKQVMIETKEKKGHLDWVSQDPADPKAKCIIDVKFTKTKQEDWRNGWGDIETKEDAKTQAAHYISIYQEKYGEWVPFYFIVFGESGWIKVIEMIITEDGKASYDIAFEAAKEIRDQHIKEGWLPKPEFNRCLNCDFNEICPYRATLPTITQIYF